MVTLQQIQKKYYDTLIISVPNLELSHGIYWLQGGNGAGKTTCLKVIAGLVPFDGDVLITIANTTAISSKKNPTTYRRCVSYAEAEPLYPAFLTGRDLLQLHTGTRGEGYENITELSSLLGIPDFIHNPVSSYSSGMLKKLSLLLAFTGKPALILLDEPLITLDTATIPVLYEWIRRFHTQYGVSFCITSHQLITAGELPLTATLIIENKELKKI